MSSQFSACEWASGEAREEGWGKEGVSRAQPHCSSLLAPRISTGFVSSHHSVSHLAVFHTLAQEQAEEREKGTRESNWKRRKLHINTTFPRWARWVNESRGCQCSRRISDCRWVSGRALYCLPREYVLRLNFGKTFRQVRQNAGFKEKKRMFRLKVVFTTQNSTSCTLHAFAPPLPHPPHLRSCTKETTHRSEARNHLSTRKCAFFLIFPLFSQNKDVLS